MFHQNSAEDELISLMKAKDEDSSVNHVMITVDIPEGQDRGLQDVRDLHQNTMTTGSKSMGFFVLYELNLDKQQTHVNNTAGGRQLAF